MWKECVIDASMPVRDGLFTFCPIVGDINEGFQVVTGMNYVSSVPPESMKLVAIWHPDGQEAVEEFCKQHDEALSVLRSSV